jgi:dienelactone hydrolase/pimeloyl-ACP methyl ester carboxylesterase
MSVRRHDAGFGDVPVKPVPHLVPISRRSVLRTGLLHTAALTAAPLALPEPAHAQDGAMPARLPLNRFPRMVQEYFIGQVRAAVEPGQRRMAAVRGRREAEAYVHDVKEKIRRCFGPFPERCPLNPRVTGVVRRDGYRIEKVLFDSRPEFPVSANLYLPESRVPVPGVIGSCGHSLNGKAADAYQSFAQGLARLGFACLIFDPIGQGERFQYLGPDLTSRLGGGVGEHLRCGNQQFLVGEFLGAWRAWDGIRALDYLLTRPEIDRRHVGVTGNSGGGTMTTWLCGLDDRWTMAAPSCFVTSFIRNMENELPADTEQCPPRALALGLDHADFLAALAPRPVLLLAKERDYFDVRGSEAANGRLRRLSAALGKEKNAGFFAGPTEHGYTQENREAMYRWFLAATGREGDGQEPPLTIEKDETLWCTPRGQVGPQGARTVFAFTRDASRSLAARRGTPAGDELRTRVRKVLRLSEPPVEAPHFRILRPHSAAGYPRPRVSVYAVETEPGIQALVYRLSDAAHLSRPPRSGPQAVLYVSHHSADAELREEPLIRELLAAQPEAAFFTCDVRGIGDSRPDTCGTDSFRNPYGSDYFYAIHSLMLDRPYLGMKTHDVRRVLAFLRAAGHTEIHLCGRGWGSLPALFAALFEPAVTRVTLKNAPASYAEIAETEDYNWPLSCLLPGVLAEFDLPDCCRELRSRNLRLVEPWNARQQSF